MDVVILLLAAAATALATGLGAVPVFLFGARAAAVTPALWGLTVGLMTVASFVGLLAPALDEANPSRLRPASWWVSSSSCSRVPS
jgi:ZIP family zinc transporter